MATLYRNDTDTDSIIPWRSMTQETATTSSTSISSIEETDEIKKYRFFWWKTGNMHPKARWEEATLPYELVAGIPYDTYVEQTDRHNIRGWWEWENGTIRVIELPSIFHESCVSAIADEIMEPLRGVKSTNASVLGLGAMTTKSRGSGKEADASFRPMAKSRVNRNGCDTSGTQPWPNLVVEVAYTQSEVDVKNKVENYWLQGGRAHDAIVIKIEELIAPATRPSVMTAWHYCINNRTATGALDPTMYEFGTVDRQGNQINPQIGQNVINIQLNCLYFGMSSNFVIPSSLPNPIPIDLYHVQFAILNCVV